MHDAPKKRYIGTITLEHLGQGLGLGLYFIPRTCQDGEILVHLAYIMNYFINIITLE